MSEGQISRTTNATKLVAIILGLPWVEILAEAWKYSRKLLRGLASEGIYEVLEWENVLEIHDKNGKKATFRKREKVRFLQDNIIAYQDQAWGDGEILLNYKCTPGNEADRYRSGYRTYILISLREVKQKGDLEDFNIQWDMKNSFLRDREQWETHIGHRVKHLKISVIFPRSRPPITVSIIEGNRKRTRILGGKEKTQLPDGRWRVTWEEDRPRLFENYIINWDW